MNMYDILIRKAAGPLHLLMIENVMKELEKLQEKVETSRQLIGLVEVLDHRKELPGLRPRDDFIKYEEFLAHFAQLPEFMHALTRPGSDFIKMLELDHDLFILRATPGGLVEQVPANQYPERRCSDSFETDNNFEPKDESFEEPNRTSGEITENRTSTNKRLITKEEEMKLEAETRLNQTFNLFHFKILALMACRGTAHDKAGYLFDLVRAKQ